MAEQLKATLLLSRWSITLEYKDEGPDDGTLAQVSPDSEYLTAEIEIFPDFWELDRFQQVRRLTHEFVHVLLTPIQDNAENLSRGVHVTPKAIRDACESTTEHVTSILMARVKVVE